ncbi:MAG TPA: type II CAAX endopeptidase family protein [Anoxybacillus sp.]|jgi:uncharacterized protein|nr:type II CAAX endopeptidase family protein [Anoxybacillus sp.]
MKLSYLEFHKSKLTPEERPNYNKTDFLISISYFLYLTIVIFICGWALMNIGPNGKFFVKSPFNMLLFGLFISIIELTPLIFILKFRKQSFRTIGLRKEMLFLSFIVGVIFAIPELVLSNENIISLKSIIGIVNLLIKFFYYFFCIALVEELIFRGYLQSIFQGVLSSKWISIVIVGMLFSLMHIPFRFWVSGQEFLPFIQNEISLHLPYTFIAHFYFLLIYRLTNNIVAPATTHALVDLFANL